MQNKKFLSIIVPVYNVEKFLPDCLDSLLAQNIDKSEYEIICINDGSTDDSLNILRSYENKYSNIVIIDKDNAGVSSARNDGIAIAKGDYIWFVDSDDCVLANILGEMKKLADSGEYRVIKFGMERVKEDFAFSETPEELLIKTEDKVKLIGPTVWGCLISKDLLDEKNIRFEEGLAYCEDALFTYYVSINLNEEKCVHISNKIYKYRKRITSVSRLNDVSRISKQVKSFFLAAERYKKEFETNISLNEQQRSDTLKRQHLATMNGLTYLPATSFTVKETIKDLKERGLYPFPILWWHLSDAKKSRGMKLFVIELLRNMVRFPLFLKLYCHIAKKTNIVNKHRENF